MSKLMQPKVFLVGYTCIDWNGLREYLEASDNTEFDVYIRDALARGLSHGEILTSFFAKLCYASLSLGKNKNIEATRDIPSNLAATLKAGHGSVFEHASINFVVQCSRVCTHELVRHRVGTAFSQTSGRYVRGDEVNIAFDPILEPVREEVVRLLEYLELKYSDMIVKLGLNNEKDFDRKKKLTSALRRLLPNGQMNEIGFSVNLRALRHTIMVRTSRHAEWEIRDVFAQVYELTRQRYPMLYSDAKVEVVDDCVEITGMRLQPYEVTQ